MKYSQNLEKLVGLKILRFNYGRDGSDLAFENGAQLAIYNNVLIKTDMGNSTCSVEGATVSEVREAGSLIAIIFDNGLVWEVSLAESAYLGPESMQLRFPGEPIIVWRFGE